MILYTKRLQRFY